MTDTQPVLQKQSRGQRVPLLTRAKANFTAAAAAAAGKLVSKSQCDAALVDSDSVHTGADIHSLR